MLVCLCYSTCVFVNLNGCSLLEITCQQCWNRRFLWHGPGQLHFRPCLTRLNFKFPSLGPAKMKLWAVWPVTLLLNFIVHVFSINHNIRFLTSRINRFWCISGSIQNWVVQRNSFKIIKCQLPNQNFNFTEKFNFDKTFFYSHQYSTALGRFKVYSAICYELQVTCDSGCERQSYVKGSHFLTLPFSDRHSQALLFKARKVWPGPRFAEKFRQWPSAIRKTSDPVPTLLLNVPYISTNSMILAREIFKFWLRILIFFNCNFCKVSLRRPFIVLFKLRDEVMRT